MSTADRTEPPRGRGSGRARARPVSSAIAATQLPARGDGLRLPGLRQGARRRLRLRARRAPLQRGPGAERPQNIWHFEELLPIVDAAAQARVGQHSGYTPLIRADRLGAELGLRNLYLKDDSTSRPSLSYKDRVVSMSVARLLERGETEIGCVSTGNVGTAVASLAAKAGVDAYVVLPQPPGGHEGARVHGARREGLPGRGQLRRSQPALPRSRRSDRHGLRQHHAAAVLRRGRQDGRVRDRRAARVARARAHRHGGRRRHAVLAPAQGSVELQQLGLSETDAHARSTSRSRAAATRSPARSSPRRPRSTRSRPRPPRTRSRSARPATAIS